MEIGETLAGCSQRETLEETCLRVEVDRVVGIYTDPRHVFAYDDGEVRPEFPVCFHAHVIDGSLAVSDGFTGVAFYDPQDLPRLSMVESIRQRIRDYLADDSPAIR